MPVKTAVSADPPHDPHLIGRADTLAREIGLPVLGLGDAGCDLRLVVTPDRLELRVERGELAGGKPVCADLTRLDTTSPAGRSLSGPLFKAVGIKKGSPHRPSVVDCTAGLGGDAWLLAAHGCRVDAFERQPVVGALCGDALRRAAQSHPEIARRVTLHRGDAIGWPDDRVSQADRSSLNQHPGPRRGGAGPDVPAGAQGGGTQADARAASVGRS